VALQSINLESLGVIFPAACCAWDSPNLWNFDTPLLAARFFIYHELDPNRFGRKYNRMVEYRKGSSRSLYRKDSIPFRVFPDLVANCLRYGIYRLLGKTEKAYKTEGRIMKSWGYLVGKMRRKTAA